MLSFFRRKKKEPEHERIEKIIRSVGVSTERGSPSQVEALRKIALNDHIHTSNASLALGLIYLFGYGVQEDPDESKYWCHRAVEKGNVLAEELLEGKRPISPYGDPVTAVTERTHSFGFKWVNSGMVNETCDFITAFPEKDVQRILELLLEGDNEDWSAFLLLFENFLKSKGIVRLLGRVEAGHCDHCEFSQYLIENMDQDILLHWFGWKAYDTEEAVLKEFDDLFIGLLSSENDAERSVGHQLAFIFRHKYEQMGPPEDQNPKYWQTFIETLRDG